MQMRNPVKPTANPVVGQFEFNSGWYPERDNGGSPGGTPVLSPERQNV